MLHNPGGSGGVSLRNDRENRSFRKVVYMFHIPPAKWCICDIYHLRQHRENGAISVYIYIDIYMYMYIYDLHLYLYTTVTSASSLSYLCSLSPRFILLLPGGAEVCPTIPPTEHRPPHTPDASGGSGAEVPATLTCWSDPDPHTTEGASEGGAPTNNSQTHACSIST